MADEQENIVNSEVSEEKEKLKPNYLEMTLHSNILPLDMRFSQINGCYNKLPRAYRSFTYVNSVIEGVISPEQYMYASDETESGIKLSIWNITQAIKSVRELEKVKRNIDFITARVSPQLVRQEDFYGFVKNVFDDCGFNEPEKICLEFPRTILFENPEQARMALINMKLLKVKTMMSGCGEKDNPITLLLKLPFDFVILAPWLTTLSDDRMRQSGFETLVSFIRSTGCQIIADGVKNDKQIQVLARADCFGYIPSSAYSGDVQHGRLRMPIDEAKLQDEEEG